MTTQDLERAGFVLVGGEWVKPPKPSELPKRVQPALVPYMPKKVKNEIDHLPSGAKPQQTVRNASVRPIPRKEGDPTCRRVSVVSYRKKLIDPDNLCVKYFIDALRYEKVLDDDTAKHITLEVRQEKSDNPRTEIEIT